MISVILPTYNREKTIKRSIQSVLDQTYQDIELIVVDDGSTDKTCDILESICDPRLIYEEMKYNSGACAARNRGIELAKGEYISFQDSDDVWKTEKLEKQLAALQETNADIVFCTMESHKADDTLPTFVPNQCKEGFIGYLELLNNSIVSTQTIFGKSECFRDIQFDVNMPRLQDWDLILRMAEKYKIYYQKDVLVVVYIQPDSITKNPQKGVIAINKIIEKHKGALNGNPYIKAQLLYKLGNLMLEANQNPTKLYFSSLMSQFRKNTFAKLLLSSVGLLSPIYKKQKKI